MGGHLLGVFEQAAIEQIDGDTGRAEAVAANLCEKPGLFGAAYDHAARVVPRHAIGGELLDAAAWTALLPLAAAYRAEQRRVLVGGNAGGRHIGVEILLEQMVRRHIVLLAAFF